MEWQIPLGSTDGSVPASQTWVKREINFATSMFEPSVRGEADTVSTLKVRHRVRQILSAMTDLRMSQKDIYRILEGELGKPLCAEGKVVVKEEIEMFLLDRASQPQEGGSGENMGATTDVEQGRINAKRELDMGGRPGGKKSKTEPRQPPAANGARLSDVLPGHYQISTRRFVGLSRFGGKLLVNIREYYEKDGGLAPGAKGLSLTGPQFEELCKKTAKVDAALEQDPFVETQFKLSENRFCTVREYGGKLLVDLREYYLKETEMLPGKKGISLTAEEQWVNLKAAMPALQRQLAEDGGTGMGVPGQPGHAGEQNMRTAGAEHASRNAPAGGPIRCATVVAEGKYRLAGSKKFLTLENWKGQDIVDIREQYEDGGTWKPGKKGISLSSGQVEILLANLDAITDALDRQDQGYALELTNKRRVTVSSFNGAFMVNIREYFERDGQLLPTKKGISLMQAQWAGCREAIAKVGETMTF